MTARWKKALVAGVVIASLAAPAAAYGSPAGAVLRNGVAVTAQRLQSMRDRIAKVLERRRVRFDNVAARIGLHVSRLQEIADKVESKGGDTTKARAMLDQAKANLDQAKATEAEAVAAFKAVPSSPDRWAAFLKARRIATEAVQKLREARSWTLRAARELRRLAGQLRGSSENSGTV